MSAITLVEIILVGLGMLLVWAGFRFDNSLWVNSGVMLVGLGIAAGGVHAMITREIRFRRRHTSDETYRGCAAILMGAAISLAGGGLMLVGLLLFQGVAEAAWHFVLRRPGFLLLFVGAALLAYGSAFILGPQEHQGQTGWGLALSLPQRLGGVILLGLAVAALAVGLFEFLLPSLFDAWLISIIGPIPILTD
jgi:hypothetical protein